MRKIAAISSICLLMVGFFSCKKNNGVVTGGTITATVNGTTFVSETVSEQANPSGLSSGLSFINVFTATDSSNTGQIILYLDSLAAGTYSYDTGLSNALQYNMGNSSYGTVARSKGSIIITPTGGSANSITGTFSGVVRLIGTPTDTVIITNGVFTNCVY